MRVLQLQKKIYGKVNTRISWVGDREVSRQMLKKPQPDAGCCVVENEEELTEEGSEGRVTY
jgi:hypothetical protein